MKTITLPIFDPQSQLVETISKLRHDSRNTIAQRFLLTVFEIRARKYGAITHLQRQTLRRIASERGVKL